MIIFDSKNNKTLQTFQQRSKKIYKDKEFNFNKEINSSLERRRFIDNTC